MYEYQKWSWINIALIHLSPLHKPQLQQLCDVLQSHGVFIVLLCETATSMYRYELEDPSKALASPYQQLLEMRFYNLTISVLGRKSLEYHKGRLNDCPVDCCQLSSS